MLIVGGYVRDLLLNAPSKDVDIEVYGLSYEQIKAILAPHFHVNFVGQSFGVLKVDQLIDVALPRRESKSGIGHKGFKIDNSPNVTYEEAFARRDFTINAIGMRLDGSFCDPYNGIEDIKRKTLRATSSAFKDDPLRVLRGMQMAARFGFTMDQTTIQYCRQVFNEFSTLSPERIYGEWEKWALKGEHPELGLEVLLETGWIQGFPYLAALVNCPQNPEYHPEGDVWTHTLGVCREAAVLLREYPRKLSNEERLAVMFAALCHDFGKPVVACRDETGALRSHGHAEIGAPMAEEFLLNMRAPLRVAALTRALVAEHMTCNSHSTLVSASAVRRLAKRLEPANIKLLSLLCQADALGCGAPMRYIDGVVDAHDWTPDELRAALKSGAVRFYCNNWLDVASELDLVEKSPKPILQGRYLLPLGIKPGAQIGKILNVAFEAQLDGLFDNVEDGIEYLRDNSVI